LTLNKPVTTIVTIHANLAHMLSQIIMRQCFQLLMPSVELVFQFRFRIDKQLQLIPRAAPCHMEQAIIRSFCRQLPDRGQILVDRTRREAAALESDPVSLDDCLC
jgi:hypothetical protein